MRYGLWESEVLPNSFPEFLSKKCPNFSLTFLKTHLGQGCLNFSKMSQLTVALRHHTKQKQVGPKSNSILKWIGCIRYQFWLNFFCVIIHIGSKNIVSLKKCWVWNFFFSKNFFCLKKFLAWKIWSEKMFGSRKIIELGKMFGFVRNLGSQKDWLLKYFQPWPVLTWLDFTCSHLTCPDLICSDLICSDLTCPDLTSPDLTWSDLPRRNFPDTLPTSWRKKSNQDRSSQDRASQDRSSQDRSSPDRSSQDRPSHDRSSQYRSS